MPYSKILQENFQPKCVPARDAFSHLAAKSAGHGKICGGAFGWTEAGKVSFGDSCLKGTPELQAREYRVSSDLDVVKWCALYHVYHRQRVLHRSTVGLPAMALDHQVEPPQNYQQKTTVILQELRWLFAVFCDRMYLKVKNPILADRREKPDDSFRTNNCE